jgi:hypothetical protein
MSETPKLATILVSDVVLYGRLAGADQVGMVATASRLTSQSSFLKGLYR